MLVLLSVSFFELRIKSYFLINYFSSMIKEIGIVYSLLYCNQRRALINTAMNIRDK
jgi:hypothetical protein